MGSLHPLSVFLRAIAARALAGAAIAAWTYSAAATTAFIYNFDTSRTNELSPGGPTIFGSIFNDSFGDGAPPPFGPYYSGTPATPFQPYFVTGTYAGGESGGRLLLDSANGALIMSSITGATLLQSAQLATFPGFNSAPFGLTSDVAFSVTGRFSIGDPGAGNGYGLRLRDTCASGCNNNDAPGLYIVHQTGGGALLRFNDTNFAGGTNTNVDSVVLTPPADALIQLKLAHEPGALAATASFAYVVNGVVGTEQALTGSARLFTGENWTRGEFFIFQAVPEPSTYAMILAGLALLGFVARRRMR
ncbi:MAG TPA: PEP-CTERM sorting domain-containing protein [Burkholderiales bacterium]|nr:PEP-CTERM sorting domain-containing protein [Burkholderiales bacterium]